MSEPTRIDSVVGTRLDSPTGDGKTRLDSSMEGILHVGQISLPSSLSAAYRMVEPMPTHGAEADLFIIESIEATQRFVLKLYRRGLKPKREVIEILQTCSHEHVVELVTWGESDGLWYEVLEYGKHGTLRDMLRHGPVSSELLTSVLRELLVAIEHIHSRNIIHRDLKPENILIRKIEPLDLILADFGIASLSDATQHFTTKSRTIKYGAPEAAAGAVGDASDYWSLGLIILEGLSGKHPFDGLSDLSIAVQLATRGIDLAEVTDLRWQRLCKGLLTRDPKKRWACQQVSDWLNGGMPDVAVDELERPSQRPYKISGRECWTVTELALEFGRNWSEGEKHIARDLVLPWLRDELRDQDAANYLIDISVGANRPLTAEDRLVRLIANLGKGLPPIWRGFSLDQETLISLCRDALQGNSEKGGLIEILFEREVLNVWGEAGNEDCAQLSQRWKSSAKYFASRVKEISEGLGMPQKVPDQRAYLPGILLLILSHEFREATKSEVLEFSEQASRCPWLAKTIREESFTSLLVIRLFREEAVRLGNEEIEAASELQVGLNRLEHEYPHLLNSDRPFQREIWHLRNAVSENWAKEAIAKDFPELERKMFEEARSSTVKESFRLLRRRLVVEIFADGILMASIFLAIRMWMGIVISGDGFGNIAAHLDDGSFGSKVVVIYYFVLISLTAIAWFGLKFVSRLLAKSLFGDN